MIMYGFFLIMPSNMKLYLNISFEIINSLMEDARGVEFHNV